MTGLYPSVSCIEETEMAQNVLLDNSLEAVV